MIRHFLTSIAARWLNRAARKHRISERQAIRSKARQIRAELGLPALEIIE